MPRKSVKAGTKAEQKEALVQVTRTAFGATKGKAESITIRPFTTETATVSVKAGLTVPGDGYSSTRVDVFLSIPCYVEEIDEVYKEARAWVKRRLEYERRQIENPTG